MTTLAGMVSGASARFATAGVPSPQVDAEILAAHVLGVSLGEMLARQIAGSAVGEPTATEYEQLVRRRESREPLQHLIGYAAFMDFEVAVGPGVFVPRPETEVLVEAAIARGKELSNDNPSLHIVDVCSGSGVIALAMARALPLATVWAVEVSPEAGKYLHKNVQQCAPHVRVWHKSVQDFGPELADQSVDMMLSNPPYVPVAEVPNQPEAAQWDPALALYGGLDGLDVVREIVTLGARALRPGGWLMVEHSNLHKGEVQRLLQDAGYLQIVTASDLTGRDRFSSGIRP
jgi:release factor glutamine methyltransferase